MVLNLDPFGLRWVARLFSQFRRPEDSLSTYQCEFDLSREGLLVVGGLDEDDDGRGHGFGQLVRPYGVVLQGEVGEGHEAAEAQSQPHDPAHGEALRRENVHLVADVESEPRDHEVNQGQGHVGEAVVHVDPLVDEDDADGGQQVDQQSGDDAPVDRKIKQLVGHVGGGSAL